MLVLEAAQPAAPAVVSGPVYYRTYTGSAFGGAPSVLSMAATGLGIYTTSSNSGGNSFKLPLDLPSGAMVTRVSLSVIDNDPTANLTVDISRFDPFLGNTPSQVFIASISTTNAVTSANKQVITATGTPIFTVDNSTYAYILRYQPVVSGNAHVVYGARVEYSMPTNFLPFANR